MVYGKLNSRFEAETGTPMKRFLATIPIVFSLFSNSAISEFLDAATGGFSLAHEFTIDAARGDVLLSDLNELGGW